MRDILDIIRLRHSCRVPFDPDRPIPDVALRQILEAARWAPTPHNMQNFEIIVVDDKATLAAMADIQSGPTETFLRENYRQLSFSEEELLEKKTGLLACMFPKAWRKRDAKPEAEAGKYPHGSMLPCPALLLVVYDMQTRAPDSEGDVLGIMGLGFVMQNMWLMSETLGIGMQIVSAFAGVLAENDVRRILRIPAHMKIAFSCRLGYPEVKPPRYLRVRRDVSSFVYHNGYGECGR
jgi:nitroreductase